MKDFRPGRFQVLPTVVKNLIIINVIFVFAQYVLGTTMHIDLADWLGLHYWGSQYFHWWQIVTHMFMHGSYNDVNATLLHIFSNMFALWMFGSILENVFGPKRFLAFYLVCGLGAALCHLAVVGYQYTIIEKAFEVYQGNANVNTYAQFLHAHLEPIRDLQSHATFQSILDVWRNDPSCGGCVNDSKMAIQYYLHGHTNALGTFKGIFDEATVGASGAVFGVLFAFGYMFPNTLLYFYFLVPIKAKWFVALYALFELYSGIKNSAGDNIAHFAHLGGMLFAFILLRIWNKRNRNDFY